MHIMNHMTLSDNRRTDILSENAGSRDNAGPLCVERHARFRGCEVRGVLYHNRTTVQQQPGSLQLD